MKFVEDDKPSEGVELQTIDGGEMFQWDSKYWMQCIDTIDEATRITRSASGFEGLCVGVCLEDGQLKWIPMNTLVVPIDARIRVIGRTDK